ncbi:MAG: hypothetical protein Q8898_01895 [Bacillota bacterium]|nr:hypothetical protein [Bacillota bacterium]
MNEPISIFILDVSNSSLEKKGEELTLYLDELVNWIEIWTEDIGPIKIKHRAGDEIIFVGHGYSTAYTLAFFVSRVWKYKEHKPYFGLSFGDIDKSLAEIDIEKWIHPLIKQARYANDSLKQEQSRPQFRFELDQFYSNEKNITSYNQFRAEFETLINTLLHLQQQYIRKQTEIQEQVCSLYLILQQQKAIGELLGRTAPTISSHFKKGFSEEILMSFKEIVSILISLEKKSYLKSGIDPSETNKTLTHLIRNHLKANIKSMFDL